LSRRGRFSVLIRAWRSYAGAPPSVRLFLLGRVANLPLGALDGELQALRGRVLSVGAGHGLLERYLALANPQVEVDAVELDERRVEVATASAQRAPRVLLQAMDVRALDFGAGYDAVLAVDLLHHLDPDDQATLLSDVAARLRPGGMLLVKDIARTPRWQWTFNRAHDRLVAGPEPIHCRDPEEMATLVERAGLNVEEVRRLRHPLPYPHYLLRARA
jgi:2-polyprenyl-3-methyl-5-hydroxy-6-metoxy-1,4-benzoquinol methylase